jgi:hypothetical protein
VIERYIGSSEPVSLLPYISHRISLPLYKSISGTYLDENLKLFTTESAAPEPTSVINAQSPTQEEQRDSSHHILLRGYWKKFYTLRHQATGSMGTAEQWWFEEAYEFTLIMR